MNTLKEKIRIYAPGIILFLVFLIIGLLTYKDYGMAWDEPEQRLIGNLNYDYIFHSSQGLLSYFNKEYGAGFEMLLITIERRMHLVDMRDIFLMRHLVSHIFFLVSALFGYVLMYKLFKNQLLACLGFFMIVCSPPIYAHSFYNTKDIPCLSMFLISFAICQAAFEQKKTWLFLLLGFTCGFTTGIRIIGILMSFTILLFLLMDIFSAATNKEHYRKNVLNTIVYAAGFTLVLYLSWPFVWKDTANNFMVAYHKMAHFIFDSPGLLNGKYYSSQHQPRRYFPIWFLVTNPVVWLITGFVGILLLLTDIIRNPSHFIRNTVDRNFVLYFICFAAPIVAVIYMRSVMYDGWRHLYFVYPPFILLALYFINKVYRERLKMVVLAACLAQACSISYFMIKYHPVQQVYFNSLVSHDKEFLRTHYEFEYWGVSYLQALQHLAKTVPGTIKLCYGPGGEPTTNNIMMLPNKDRERVQMVEQEQADYFITNFRNHPASFPNPVEFSIVVLNSTAVCVYKVVH